jgi:TrmH family RNA methyltransferase
MLSKNKIKLIGSLSNKKYRDELSLFVVEGTKSVLDIAQYYPCDIVFATAEWLQQHTVKANETIEVDEDELKKISFLKTPQQVLAVFQKKEIEFNAAKIEMQLSLALDNVQDPGNLGTIVRIADWFGVENIFCSTTCADVFNPKTVQATMGAIGRVKIHYVELHSFIKGLNSTVEVFGTFLNGDDIYKKQLPQHGLIVMGSEGKGISPDIEQLISSRLFIPNFPQGVLTSESLNVAVATAIVCSEFRRR